MPTYEYRCEACAKEFETVLTISAHEKARVTCPKCGSAKVAPLMATFSAKTSRKS